MNNNKNIKHIGILGMKWGRRKGRTESSDFASVKTLRKKKIHELSNDELKKLNNRLQLERTFKDLNKRDISTGKKLITDILENSGKQLASQYLAKYAGKGIEALLATLKVAQ